MSHRWVARGAHNGGADQEWWCPDCKVSKLRNSWTGAPEPDAPDESGLNCEERQVERTMSA